MCVRLSLFSMFCFFSFFSCSSPSKLQVEMVLSEPVRFKANEESGDKTTFRNKRAAVSAQNESKIEVFNQHSKCINYQLQGFVSSSGLAINRVKRIGLEKVMTGDSLLLKHIVEIVRIPGKEGNLVMGYNYTKNESVRIPDSVRFVRFELYEKKTFRSPYDQNQDTIKCVATADVIIN